MSVLSDRLILDPQILIGLCEAFSPGNYVSMQ